jgi:hypothetical protein
MGLRMKIFFLICFTAIDLHAFTQTNVVILEKDGAT